MSFNTWCNFKDCRDIPNVKVLLTGKRSFCNFLPFHKRFPFFEQINNKRKKKISKNNKVENKNLLYFLQEKSPTALIFIRDFNI